MNNAALPLLPTCEDDAQDIYENASCAHLSARPDGLIVKANRMLLEWTGYEAGDILLRKRFEDFLPPAARLFYQSHFVPMLLMQGVASEVTLELQARDGTRRRVMVSATLSKDASGNLRFCRITLFSAADRIRYEEALLAARRKTEEANDRLTETNRELQCANEALHRRNEHLHVTLKSVADGVIATDEAGRICFLNPVAARMCGWEEREAVGQRWQTVFRMFTEPNGKPGVDVVRQVLEGRSPAHAEPNVLLHRDNAGRTYVMCSATAMRDEASRAIGAIIVVRDISEVRELSVRMHHLATHDSLTGLINRDEFERQLQCAMDSATDEREHAMLYIDLNQFEVVNDTCGHAAGDQLLKQLATVMREHLRPSDTLARLGGDEFGVLLHHCAAGAARFIAERIRQAMADFRFACHGRILPITVSIGLVGFARGGMTVAQLLRTGDTACHMARDLGRNRIYAVTHDDEALAQRLDEMDWVGKIQKALDDNRFVLYAQRIAPLRQGRGRDEYQEILLRLRDDDGSLVPPMNFIPAAERYGLMPQIDRWVIAKAFAHCAGRARAGDVEAKYAINLSGRTVMDESFFAFVCGQFELHGLPPANICFEITETAAINNLVQAAKLIRELRAMGCRFSLDDFGRRMSSFSYLKQLPVDYLKIDGSFIRNILNDPMDYAMVESINQIGHIMGSQTIAEFVESNAVMQVLLKIGVDFVQGYGVDLPVPMVPEEDNDPNRILSTPNVYVLA